MYFRQPLELMEENVQIISTVSLACNLSYLPVYEYTPDANSRQLYVPLMAMGGPGSGPV